MSENNSNDNNKENPLKAVKTSPLPTKHEFSADHSKKNTEKRDKNN